MSFESRPNTRKIALAEVMKRPADLRKGVGGLRRCLAWPETALVPRYLWQGHRILDSIEKGTDCRNDFTFIDS